MYKIVKQNYLGTETQSIKRDNGNGSFTSIPMIEDNTDYQAYLKWLAEGNTPLPADE